MNTPHFHVFQTCLLWQTKLHFVNTQSTKIKQAGVIQFKSYKTKSGTTNFVQTKLIRIVKSNIINYLNTSNIFSSVKSKHLLQQKFSGALWCTVTAIQTAHLPCRFPNLLILTSLHLLFELNFNIANFFLRHFYFKEKQNRLIAKNTLSKNPKWHFMIFFSSCWE